MNPEPQFSKMRNYLWPIASYELKKFVPMLFLIFLIAGNYNLLKIIKDATVIPAAGAEVIPFIKVWLLLPMAVLMTAFFSYVVHLFDEDKAFYIIISTFLSYFLLFTFLLYPYRDFFNADSLANTLEAFLPQGARGLVSLVRYWHLCIFYAMCEIWGTTVLFVLFWGFANRVTALNEAKRFYALFGLAGNSSGIFAPLFFTWASQTDCCTYFPNPWENTLAIISSGVLLSGFLTLGIYFIVSRQFNRLQMPNEPARQQQKAASPAKKERKPFWESLKLLAHMPYIRNITIIVISYNIIINLTEVLWKAQLKALYPNQVEYGLYFGKVMMITGFLATISDLLLCSNLIRRYGWTVAALITPIILALTSVGFFGFMLFDTYLEAFFVSLFGLSPLVLSVFFGSLQNALARAAKYSLFDATKEISFIPLDAASRIQSKAAIDGVCSRLGKSGGSVIYQVFLLGCGSLTACIPYIAMMIAAISCFWISSVISLGKNFKRLTQTPSQAPEAKADQRPLSLEQLKTQASQI